MTSDGAVWAWGSNRFGQAGTGTDAGSSLPLPLPIPVLTDVRQVAAGRQHSLALRRDGTADSLPAGFSLNGATGLLSGTASATGSLSFTVTATDAFGCWSAKPYTLAVTTCTHPPTRTPTAPLPTARLGHTATFLSNRPGAAGVSVPFLWGSPLRRIRPAKPLLRRPS